MKPSLHRPRTPERASLWLTLCMVSSVTWLATGCGGGSGGVTAAKVNKDEIPVAQVQFVLQQRGVKPEQTEAAGRQVLERLIDQQLALQKATDMKLDRDPRVAQQLEIVRREVLARAYAEKVGEVAVPPTADEVRRYYDERPALFRERRIYSIQEVNIEATPEQVPELRADLASAQNINAFIEVLKAKGLRFQGGQAVRAAEQLPGNSLDTFARMRDGQALVVPTASGMQVLVLAGSRSQPVSEEQARAVIEQRLLNERKRKLVEDDLKALRAAAKVEYLGPFAGAAGAGGAGASALFPDQGASAALPSGELGKTVEPK